MKSAGTMGIVGHPNRIEAERVKRCVPVNMRFCFRLARLPQYMRACVFAIMLTADWIGEMRCEIVGFINFVYS